MRATEHIGLIATGSTTFDEPYHVARRFASLDHISGGRAGWNIVTTSNPDAALNFGLDDHMEHAERYKRAREFYDVVTGLWDSFADDAFVRDVESGCISTLRNASARSQGENTSVRGPLNIRRPVQGWPLIGGGASEDGSNSRGKAEAVFTGASSPRGENSCRHKAAGWRRLGPQPRAPKILPGAVVVVGDRLKRQRKKGKTRPHGAYDHHRSLGAARHRRLRLTPGIAADPETNAERAGASGWSMPPRATAPVRQISQRVGDYGGYRSSHAATIAAIWRNGGTRQRRLPHHVSVPARRLDISRQGVQASQKPDFRTSIRQECAKWATEPKNRVLRVNHRRIWTVFDLPPPHLTLAIRSSCAQRRRFGRRRILLSSNRAKR